MKSINLTEVDRDVQRAVFVSDKIDTPEAIDKINASTLEGHSASYFALASDITGLQNTKADKDIVTQLIQKVNELTDEVNRLKTNT